MVAPGFENSPIPDAWRGNNGQRHIQLKGNRCQPVRYGQSNTQKTMRVSAQDEHFSTVVRGALSDQEQGRLAFVEECGAGFCEDSILFEGKGDLLVAPFRYV